MLRRSTRNRRSGVDRISPDLLTSCYVLLGNRKSALEPLYLNQVFTPLWPEHAPWWCTALLYVPSLHWAVASAGASAGRGDVGAASLVLFSAVFDAVFVSFSAV